VVIDCAGIAIVAQSVGQWQVLAAGISFAGVLRTHVSIVTDRGIGYAGSHLANPAGTVSGPADRPFLRLGVEDAADLGSAGIQRAYVAVQANDGHTLALQ
jgi:hypothetical protein